MRDKEEQNDREVRKMANIKPERGKGRNQAEEQTGETEEGLGVKNEDDLTGRERKTGHERGHEDR